jgi:hypothetical protein
MCCDVVWGFVVVKIVVFEVVNCCWLSGQEMVCLVCKVTCAGSETIKCRSVHAVANAVRSFGLGRANERAREDQPRT